MMQNKANLDPWHVLRTVIDAGGFAQAAKQLQRSQSAVSYAVSKLQEQIGVDLLTIKGRRAVLTEQGALLLERTRALLNEYEDVLELADALRKGHEPAISLRIVPPCPSSFLGAVLGEFQTHFPKTVVSINQADGGSPGDQESSLHKCTDLLVSTTLVWETASQNLGELQLVAVSHPNHPLLGCDAPIRQADLRNHRQIVIGQPYPHETDQNQAYWYVSSHQQAIEAILLGQAYGWLQEDLIGEELAKENLVPLPLEMGARHKLPIYLQYNPQRRIGPAGQALGGLIKRYFTPSP